MTNHSVDTRSSTSRIVVGVDGSAPSITALRWAAHDARRRGADVLAVSCYSVPMFGGPMGVVTLTGEDLDMFKTSAEAVVARAVELVAEIDPQVTVDGLVEMSSPAATISQAARAGDEIVIGATGHGRFIEGLLGSVASSVVHRSHVPVIVVPAQSVAEFGPTMSKIVVGLDGSAESAHALEWAYEEAMLSGAALVAVHGWTYPYVGQFELPTQMQLDAMRELTSSVEVLGPRLTDGVVQVHPRLVEKSPAEALLDEAADADLIVVGSRGRGALRASLLGSVSRTVVQHAKCPVAVIRAPQS